nr:MAG TPA: hypothetical protein [Caudoviricetes sp.]DAY10061.1 MAG TPA: hypothetical protein [Caudoviricetes sp.]
MGSSPKRITSLKEQKTSCNRTLRENKSKYIS